MLAGCASARVGAISPVGYGPAALEVTSRSALAWHRLTGAGRLQVEYASDASFAGAQRTAAVEATEATDYTVTVPLEGLRPGRDYVYRAVGVDGGLGPVGRFRTAPERADEFTFGFSGDLEAGHQPFTLLDSVRRRAPDFFFLLGDTVYADVPRAAFTGSVAQYREKHRENREDPHLARLLAEMSVRAVWDDHEVHNDFDSTSRFLYEGRQVFLEYWPVRGEGGEPTVLYRRFSWGPAADFFVLDCRQYRHPKGEADGPDKTMLGGRQKAWLKDGLRDCRAPFKFVLSTVPLHGPWGPDRWDGYGREREELLAFVRQERIEGVIVLSADVHAAVDVDLGTGVREFIAGPIGAWPLCRLVPQARRILESSGRFFICDTYNWGRFTVRPEASPPEVELEFVDVFDVVRHRTRIAARG